MSNGLGDGGTSRTYTDVQIEERARDLLMVTSQQLIAAVNGGGAMNPERVSALADATVAGVQMFDIAMRVAEPADPA